MSERRSFEHIRPMETNGFAQLVSLLGEQGMHDFFGFSKEELEVYVANYKPSPRMLSCDEIDQEYDKTFLKIHSVERDIERFQEIIRNAKDLKDHIVGLTMPGFETLLKEYLFGKNTFFYEKVVFHPETGDTKIVFYNPLIHSHESWEDAWSREDLRISYGRFIERKSEEDPLYSRHLQYRDDSELAITEERIVRAQQAYTEKPDRLPVFMSLSPAPRPSKYARGMGYATWWTKRLSHWRNYAFEPQDNAVIIRASTVFTYRNIHQIRHLMKEVVHTSSENHQRIRRLSVTSDDKDILALPFDSTFMYSSLPEFVTTTTQIDKRLNIDSSWYDRFFIFSQRATSWHNKQRLTDSQAEESILNQLSKSFLWEYFALFLHYGGNPDPYLLKELLIRMRASAVDLYATHMSEKSIAVTGGDLRTQERMKNAFIRQAMVRERGGNCPIIKKKKSKRSRETNDESEENDGNELCILVCRGSKKDSILNRVVLCRWWARADENKEYTSCPECGWYPGKIQVFESEPVSLETPERSSSFVMKKMSPRVERSRPVTPPLPDRKKPVYYYDEEKQSYFIWTVLGRMYAPSHRAVFSA